MNRMTPLDRHSDVASLRLMFAITTQRSSPLQIENLMYQIGCRG